MKREGGALSRRPAALLSRQCRVLGLSFGPRGPVANRAGLCRLERTVFEIMVTLQGLSYRDGDPHGFLGVKGEREWKTGEVDIFTKCVYPFSKCLLVSQPLY